MLEDGRELVLQVIGVIKRENTLSTLDFLVNLFRCLELITFDVHISRIDRHNLQPQRFPLPIVLLFLARESPFFLEYYHEGEPVRYEGQNLKNAYHWTRNQNPNAHFITIRPLHYLPISIPTVETQQYRIHHPDMLIYNTKAIYLLRKWVSEKSLAEGKEIFSHPIVRARLANAVKGGAVPRLSTGRANGHRHISFRS